jgi:hypothetical protein
MCLWAIYIFPGSVYIFHTEEQADPSWEYIIRSQTHECGNWDWGPDIPFLGIFVSNFQHFVFAVYQKGFKMSTWCFTHGENIPQAYISKFIKDRMQVLYTWKGFRYFEAMCEGLYKYRQLSLMNHCHLLHSILFFTVNHCRMHLNLCTVVPDLFKVFKIIKNKLFYCKFFCSNGTEPSNVILKRTSGPGRNGTSPIWLGLQSFKPFNIKPFLITNFLARFHPL